MHHRRSFIKNASLGAAGLILATGNRTAHAESADEIVVHNDYSSSVMIDLFHPESIDQVFSTWTFDSGEEARLFHDGHAINVKSDWGIRVRFYNGAESAVMRLAEVGNFKIKASNIYDFPFANYKESGLKIESIDGYDIGGQFGGTETQILTDALAVFYERFLRTHTMGCPELCTRSAYKWEPDKSQFDSDSDERDYIESQRWRFLANQANGFSFPNVELEYAYAEEDWLARAHVGIVKVLHRDPDESGEKYPVEGSFKMEINDYYVNNTRKNAHYAHPAYWAGVIAHEALHNLGHQHPPSRSDSQYYLHQMIIVEHLVMTGDKVRYGESNPTPVLCQRRP